MVTKALTERIEKYFHKREEIGTQEMYDLKVPRPLEWGLDYLNLEQEEGETELDALKRFAAEQVKESDAFFRHPKMKKVELQGDQLIFDAPEPMGVSRHPEMDRGSAYLYETKQRNRAAVLLPFWNAEKSQTDLFAKILARSGIAVARLTLPYHEERMPSDLEYAEYLFSTNIGRTIWACRQAALESRMLIDWLVEERGYRQIGILGLSLGSYLGGLVAFHDPRVEFAVYNLGGGRIARAGWEGVATEHVRKGFGDSITYDDLDQAWSVVSPTSYVHRRVPSVLKQLVISPKYDRVIPPDDTEEFVELSEQAGHSIEHRILPCSHYAFGDFPFNLMTLGITKKFLG